MRSGWLLLAAFTAHACAPPEPEPSARVRLWTLVDGTLESAPVADGTRVVLPALAPGLEGWSEITYPGHDRGGLTAEAFQDEGLEGLRLSGTRGALGTRLAVEPDTCYVFRGRLRAHGLESEEAGAAPDGRFDGARFWLGESADERPLDELVASERKKLRGWFSPEAGDDAWVLVERAFVTAPDTRTLHVVCSLAAEDRVRAGRVEFAELRLERHPRARAWSDALARAAALRRDVEPPMATWQAQRRVSARMGAEHRPSIVLLPGDRLRLRLPDLAPRARLALGLGAWGPALPFQGGPAVLRVRADGRELVARTCPPSSEALERGWEPLDLELPDGTTCLELALEGGTPLALGAPRVCSATPGPRGPNLILISIDTLRADHVGVYRGEDLGTATLDALARSGLVCRDATSQAPYTLPSHASLLTGQFPSVHGVVEQGRVLAAARSRSLAEILGAAGFATQAFTAGGYVNADFGFDRGFEGFAEIDPIRERDSHYFRQLVTKHGDKGAARLLETYGFDGVQRWLGQHAEERFFLFLHTYTVHDYDPPADHLDCAALGCAQPQSPPRTTSAEEVAAYTPGMRAHIVHLYDAALRYTDERLGRVIARLRELGLEEDTLIVVTSDHGEEFFEHGQLQHGRTLYEELLHVPLILNGPGIAPGESTRPAMLVDVVPTVLARLGLPPEAHVQGLDLLAGGERWPARPIWSEVDDRFAHLYALRDARGLKTIHAPATEGLRYPAPGPWQQYDLGRDPGEHEDLAARPEGAAARAALEQQRDALQALGESLGGLGHGVTTDETASDLENLGYAGR